MRQAGRKINTRWSIAFIKKKNHIVLSLLGKVAQEHSALEQFFTLWLSR